MPKTFEEILAYFDDNHAYDGDDVIEALKEAREAVGGDPSEWWVECNGERVYVGDNVQVPYDNDVYTVIGFSHLYEDNPTVFLDRRTPVPAKDVHKLIPDTREKIIEDTVRKLDPTRMLQHTFLVESITQAVDSAMKLAEVDA